MRMYIFLYVVFFLLTVFFSFLINWLFIRFASNLGIHDDEIKQVRWTGKKPSIGGFSFYIIFLLSVVCAALFSSDNDLINRQLIGITASCSLGFLIGLADDTFNTNPLVKFMGQLTCAFILLTTNVYIPISGNESVNFIFTIIWVIGLMNSINMLDNMDGITASVSCVIIVFTILVAIAQHGFQTAYLLLYIGVFGALLGFLYFNWNPSKIFMGDTGSQFLGVFLAATSIIHFWVYKDRYGGEFQIKQFILPAIAFIVPLIDTTTVSIRRIMRGQSPFVGGRDHITHQLVYFGLSERATAWLLIGISAASIPIFGLILLRQLPWTIWYSLGCAAYFLLIFGLFQLMYNHALRKKALEEKQ